MPFSPLLPLQKIQFTTLQKALRFELTSNCQWEEKRKITTICELLEREKECVLERGRFEEERMCFFSFILGGNNRETLFSLQFVFAFIFWIFKGPFNFTPAPILKHYYKLVLLASLCCRSAYVLLNSCIIGPIFDFCLDSEFDKQIEFQRMSKYN